jgi:hypothetical protein
MLALLAPPFESAFAVPVFCEFAFAGACASVVATPVDSEFPVVPELVVPVPAEPAVPVAPELVFPVEPELDDSPPAIAGSASPITIDTTINSVIILFIIFTSFYFPNLTRRLAR